MALLSLGCKATFEDLPSVQSSSTTHNSGRLTSQDGNCTCHVGKVQRIFYFQLTKSFFHYLYSAFYPLPTAKRTQECHILYEVVEVKTYTLHI